MSSYDDRPWVGFDLDGTLAKSLGRFSKDWGDRYSVGEPVESVVAIAKDLISRGIRVKIFTSRLGPHGTHYEDGSPIPADFIPKARKAIEEWCLKNLGSVVEITHEKDYAMKCFFDDRAIAVEENTGRILAGRDKLAGIA